MFPSPSKVGPQILGDGAIIQPRAGKSGELGVMDIHTKYQEPTYRGQMFSLCLSATTTGVAAGNILAAAAAAATNFALFNPIGSGKVLVLVKFAVGIISGTPGGGPIFHGAIGNVPTAAFTGVPVNNYINGPASVSKSYATAAGTTMTAGLAPTVICAADFASTNTAQASVGLIRTVEYIDGNLIVPPGTGWVPLWSAAGTSLLNGYSITWEEIPL